MADQQSSNSQKSKVQNRFPEVLHEDNHTIVVNKRSGDIVQGDKTGDEPLSEQIKRFLKKKYSKEGNVFCGVVHRLDRPTTGALVFAKTSKAIGRLNTQFRDKQTRKIYWAIVETKPKNKSGKLSHYLKKNEKQNKSYASDSETKGSKHAVLEYKLIASSDKYHLLEVELETGRHHQIRCQLGTIGCIIKGDLKYGAKRSNKDGSICLHARSLAYTHPTTKEEINVIAPVPKDPLWEFFEKNAK
ncbi:MAG: RluA family pseudouridine synthase [Crocinitomicaceae bacterium]|nr:RluA family pseudouridine synthase [Crocinitomicaceae bacterium]MDG1659357.1 RluA family pseudouridine synthase [Crocinitomicaceae bacterium]